LAAAAGVVMHFSHIRDNLPPSEVHLYAMRGPENPSVRVQSGHRLLLNLDATELPSEGEYTVRVVDSGGTEVWSGAAQQLQNPIRALVSRQLHPGRYWVRLLRGRELVREFGLQID
jgi:hypothetical protein